MAARSIRTAPATRALRCLGIFLAIEAAGLVIQYPCATLDRPYIDAELSTVDAALRFDWMAWFTATWAHPWVAFVLSNAYEGLIPFALFGVLYSGAVDGERARLFLISNAIVLGVAIVVSAFFPAVGAAAHIHASVDLSPFLPALEAARAGAWMPHVNGIIMFPSYHAALALLVGLAVPRLPVLLWAGVVIAATPIMGGHYLIDVVAGLLLATITWLGVCHIVAR